MRNDVLWVLLVLGFVVGLCRAAAALCTTDAECANGDTCSVGDVCVAGTCVLGGGGDADLPPGTRDWACDGEIDPDLSFVVNRLAIRKRTSGRFDNSSAKGKGALVVTGGSPVGAFDADEGFSLRVKDVLSEVFPSATDGIDARLTWNPADCVTALPKITCTSPSGKSFLRFKQSRLAANQWSLIFKMKNLDDLQGPFFGPVRLVFSRGTDRHQTALIQDCRLTVPGLKCREF